MLFTIHLRQQDISTHRCGRNFVVAPPNSQVEVNFTRDAMEELIRDYQQAVQAGEFDETGAGGPPASAAQQLAVVDQLAEACAKATPTELIQACEQVLQPVPPDVSKLVLEQPPYHDLSAYTGPAEK